ncbi:Hypothetical predicted protein [Mytilus galloprovincialis]|uniref:Uncharacterized protein n=1 Tax=Mytilus galloprovincialis TaxID=29158 RepID=A0A8B6BGV3_MYTGA|nr:Hypothetical predicted protein [Mytilus galloprovincialis]
MLRDSKDDKVKEANVDVRTGRKWMAKTAVEDVESRLRHRDIVGVVTLERLGFATFSNHYSSQKMQDIEGNLFSRRFVVEKKTIDKTALKDGRYTWRHGQVLREIEAQRRKKIKIEKGPKFINFINGGDESSKKIFSKASGILTTANDWEMQDDVGGRTTFLREIITTTLRPDIVLWSRIRSFL